MFGFDKGEAFMVAVYDCLLLVAQLARRMSQLSAPSNLKVGRYRGATAFVLNKFSKSLATYAKNNLLSSPQTIFDSLPEVPVDFAKSVNEAPDVGVRVVGFAGRQFGLGVSARNYLDALMSAGIPVEYIEPNIEIPHSTSDYSPKGLTRPSRVLATLFFVGPDFFEQSLLAIPEKGANELWIGCWFWELENIPSEWQKAIQKVDALMVASGFVADGFSKQTKKPIFKVPVPIEVPESPKGLNLKKLPFDKFRFLVVFDFHSSIYRKNPAGAIDAFMRAFPSGDERVSLLIKASNCVDFPGDFRALVRLARRDARITIVDAALSGAQQRGLIASADALISLHRSEGFGLVLAESMALGTLVIATGWSGNTEFMTHANACLIDYKLVSVKRHQYPHAVDAKWAEPDLDQAAILMRRLVHGQLDANNLAVVAQRGIADQLSPQKVVKDLMQTIELLASLKTVGGQ